VTSSAGQNVGRVGPEPDRVERRRGDERVWKDLHQLQRLDELAFAAVAHAGFQEFK